MTYKDCGCKGCTLMLRLQAELIDTTYLNRDERPRDEFCTCVIDKARKTRARKVQPLSDHEREERDTLMFNAGRFQAGDTDETAARAWLTMQSMFDSVER